MAIFNLYNLKLVNFNNKMENSNKLKLCKLNKMLYSYDNYSTITPTTTINEYVNCMKIALISKFGHLECLGFLLEIYKNNIIDIYISKKTDSFKWIEYYSTIYNFNVIYDKFDKEIILNKYDKIFKLTSNDLCIYDKKIISILHLIGVKNKCNSEKFISLTPYITGNDIYYTFPIYNPIIPRKYKNPFLLNSKISKTIIMIGYYNDSDIDMDLLKFIDLNYNYTFNFLISGGTGDKLKNKKNVNLLKEAKTSVMINILNNSKYILSKKHIRYDRFSGQLSLAASHEIPLIIDKKTKNNYNLPGISFDKNYFDIGNLDNITNEEYKSLKLQMKAFKENMLKKNKIIFKSEF